MPNPLDLAGPVPECIFTPAQGIIAQVLNHAAGIQKIRLQLTGVVLTITDALAYGSVDLGLVPDRNYVFVGGEGDLSCVKDGVGIVTGELPKLAVGTAAASNATLSSTMINMINGGAGGTALASGLTATWKIHSNDNVTAIPYLAIGDSATTHIYLNAAVNPTADGTLTITGSLTLYFIDLGNVVS